MNSSIEELLNHVDQWKLKLHEKLKWMTRLQRKAFGRRFTKRRAYEGYTWSTRRRRESGRPSAPGKLAKLNRGNTCYAARNVSPSRLGRIDNPPYKIFCGSIW